MEPITGTAATFGKPATIGKLSITVTTPIVGGDQSGPWLTITVHVENASSETVSVPFELHCDANPDGGGRQAQSTYTNGDAIPAGTFHDGTVNLLMPSDGRTGKPRLSCAIPAKLVATLIGSDQRFVWDIPDGLVAALNSAPQPT